MSSRPCTLSTSTALRRVDSWADCFASSASFFCSSRPGRTMITAATGAIHASCGAMIASTTTNSKKKGRSTMVEMVDEVTISRICSSSRS